MLGAETPLFETYGYADLKFDIPMTEDAVHEIGSITKQYTSVAMLKLWKKGKVDLDADVTDYLPDLDTQGHSIPVRRLFGHTSGIKSYTSMESFRPIMAAKHPRDTLVSLIGAAPFDFAPGEALIYNNSGYCLLGLIIEKVSGQLDEEYLQEQIFGVPVRQGDRLRRGQVTATTSVHTQQTTLRCPSVQAGLEGICVDDPLDARYRRQRGIIAQRAARKIVRAPRVFVAGVHRRCEEQHFQTVGIESQDQSRNLQA